MINELKYLLDLAVGAPYDGPKGKGAVYIFQGSFEGIRSKESQVCYAESIGSHLSAFGYSLSGGNDLDQNGYPGIIFSIESGSSSIVYNISCPYISRSLRSSQQGLLLVPFARTSTKQIRAFSVVGPSTWNGLPSELRIFNRTTSPAFFSHLKTALFDRAGVGSASE